MNSSNEVEIWLTCLVFRKGHRIRLDIGPKDGTGSSHFTHHHADYNASVHNTIHAGGSQASHLLPPIIPAKHQ